MLILAVEPDPTQAAHVGAIAGSLRAELVIRHSAEDALQALAERVPDLVLASPLLSWHDEMALSERLRDLGDAAAHVQTLTIPILAEPRPAARRRSVLSAMRRTRDKGATPDGCDPAVFAQQIREYLARTDGVEDPAVQAAVEDPAVPEMQEPVVLEIVVHGLVEEPVEEPIEERVEEEPVDEPVDDGFRLTSPDEHDLATLADRAAVSAADESPGFVLAAGAWDEHPVLDFHAVPDVPAVAAAPPVVEVLPIVEPDVVLLAKDQLEPWVAVPLEAWFELAALAEPAPPLADDVWVLEAEADVVPAAAPEPAPAPVDTVDSRREPAPPPPPPPRRKAAKSRKKAAQDEWGFFDPDQCGFAALVAKLDQVTEEEAADPDTTVRVIGY